MTLRYARSVEDLPGKDELLSVSGLEFMRDVLAGRRCGAAIAETLGFGVSDVEKGRVVFQGRPEISVTNPMGAIHGGWYGALLDSCMGCAVMTCMPKGSYYTTLEYKTNITRAIPIGTLVEAVGTIQHAGRTTAVAMGEVRGVEDGKLYATGSTTCLIMTG